MGLFLRKKKKTDVISYSSKNKLFPISRPWGYSPQHVDEAIKGYTEVVEKQKATITSLREEISYLNSKYAKLEVEFQNLHMQLNLVQIPEISDIQEDYVANKFKENFKQSDKMSKTNRMNIFEEELDEEDKSPFGVTNHKEKDKSVDEILEQTFSTPEDNKPTKENKKIKLNFKKDIKNDSKKDSSKSLESLTSKESFEDEGLSEEELNNMLKEESDSLSSFRFDEFYSGDSEQVNSNEEYDENSFESFIEKQDRKKL